MARCNLMVPNQLWCDLTSVILNVRARTNLPWRTPEGQRPTPFEEAMLEYAHMTQVVLVVGEMPQRWFQLFELLGRTAFDPRDFEKRSYEREAAVERADATIWEAARKMFHRHFRHEDPEAEAVYPFDREHQDVQDHWCKIARTAKAVLAPDVPHPVIVPIRQTCSIHVDWNMRARAKLAELAPKTVSPEALIWIHVEGVATRDVG